MSIGEVDTYAYAEREAIPYQPERKTNQGRLTDDAEVKGRFCTVRRTMRIAAPTSNEGLQRKGKLSWVAQGLHVKDVRLVTGLVLVLSMLSMPRLQHETKRNEDLAKAKGPGSPVRPTPSSLTRAQHWQPHWNAQIVQRRALSMMHCQTVTATSSTNPAILQLLKCQMFCRLHRLQHCMLCKFSSSLPPCCPSNICRKGY